MTGTVLNPTAIDQFDGSSNINDTLGKAGEQMVAELHGKYYTQCYRGEMFWGSTVTAAAISTYTGTSVTGLGLWNIGTGKNLIPVRTVIIPVTAGSADVAVGYTFTTNAGTGVATAAPISAATYITATRGNCNFSSTVSSSASVVLTATLTSAPTLFMGLGTAQTNAITAGYGAIVIDHDGQMVIGPGTFASLGMSAANTGTYLASIFWYEAPL